MTSPSEQLQQRLERESLALSRLWKRTPAAEDPSAGADLVTRALAGIAAASAAEARSTTPPEAMACAGPQAESAALERLWTKLPATELPPTLTRDTLANLAAQAQLDGLERHWVRVPASDLPAALVGGTLAQISSTHGGQARLLRLPTASTRWRARVAALAGVAAALLLAFGLARDPFGGVEEFELVFELPIDIEIDAFHDEVGEAWAALQIAPEEDWTSGVDWAAARGGDEAGRLRSDMERLLASMDEF